MNEDELNLDLDEIEANTEKKLEIKNRYQKLSEKVKLTAIERDEANAKAKAEADRAESLVKEVNFYKDFSTNVSKYPAAAEYQDKILEKVRGGYATDDAVLAVLAKEGKLNASSPQIQQPAPQVEGGSAATFMEGTKSVRDMNAEEKLAALLDADKSGDLANALLGR